MTTMTTRLRQDDLEPTADLRSLRLAQVTRLDLFDVAEVAFRDLQIATHVGAAARLPCTSDRPTD